MVKWSRNFGYKVLNSTTYSSHDPGDRKKLPLSPCKGTPIGSMVLRFSNDNSRVLIYSNDGPARIWDLDIDRLIDQLYNEYPCIMAKETSKTVKQKYGLRDLYKKGG